MFSIKFIGLLQLTATYHYIPLSYSDINLSLKWQYEILVAADIPGFFTNIRVIDGAKTTENITILLHSIK